ncbi:MAG: DNA-directed RNA polymerase subunit alpha C-terminal domain-containing protein [Candidatus Saccharibacteria bacterium]
MPLSLAITDRIKDNIEEALEQRYIDGFNKGHEIGYKAAFDEVRKELEAHLDLMTPSSPDPIMGADEFEIIEGPIVPRRRKTRLVSVKALGLSSKTQNALTNAGITKVKQLTEISATELRRLPRIGNVAINEVVGTLKKHGRSLRAE